MSSGQRAMAWGLLFPDTEQGKRSDLLKLGVATGLETKQVEPPHKVRLSQARTVLKFTPEAVPIVMSGAISLDTAYVDAKRLRERAELELTRPA